MDDKKEFYSASISWQLTDAILKREINYDDMDLYGTEIKGKISAQYWIEEDLSDPAEIGEIEATIFDLGDEFSPLQTLDLDRNWYDIAPLFENDTYIEEVLEDIGHPIYEPKLLYLEKLFLVWNPLYQ